MIPQWLDLLIHLFAAVGGTSAVGAAYIVVKRINRDESLKQDYPPHRHINGKIAYPRDYPPPDVEQLMPGS